MNAATAFRELADWLEAHPGMEAPHHFTGHGESISFDYYAQSKESFLDMRRKGGFHEKRALSAFLMFVHTLPCGATIELNCNKEHTCRRVKVGERVLPAEPARWIDPKPERVEEVYEWQCDDSLLADSPAEADTPAPAEATNG